MQKNLLILIVIFFSFTAFSDNTELIVKANKAYSEKKFSQAIEFYSQVIKNKSESWELYYNLGNAYFKNNEIPSAILYYEKALKLNPGNEDIQFNLKIANTKITDKIEKVPVLFYKRWWNKFFHLFSTDGWGKLTILFFISFLILISIYFFSKTLILRKIGFWLGIFFLFFSIISFSLGLEQYNSLKTETQAIVFSPTLTVKSGPDDTNSDLFVIHEGTKVRIIDHVNKWVRIKIADGSDGWAPEDKLLTI